MAKIDIISGFLGAGKTTLIKKLITDVFAGQKVVLIENEFGEIGIDGGFLKEAGINITEMNSGCICCSLVGDFAEALKQVVEQFHPDHIIIEPSGVGKLSDIRDAVERVGKDCDLEIGSLVTVADVKKVKMYMKNFGEFYNNQVESAGTIILSRTQNATKEKIDEAIAMIREKNPEATIITTPWDELSGKTIHDAMVQSVSLADLLLAEEEEHHHHHDDDDEDEHEHHHHDEDEDEHEHHHHHDHDEDDEDEHEHHHHHDHDDDEDEHEHHHHHHDHEDVNAGLSEGNRIYVGEDEHEHHHHHHHHHHGEHDADEVFDSIGIETINKYSEEEIRTALAGLGENIIRAKGIVPDHDGGWLFFDYVPGDIDIREGKPAYTGLITVIGEKVDIPLMKELFGVH